MGSSSSLTRLTLVTVLLAFCGANIVQCQALDQPKSVSPAKDVSLGADGSTDTGITNINVVGAAEGSMRQTSPLHPSRTDPASLPDDTQNGRSGSLDNAFSAYARPQASKVPDHSLGEGPTGSQSTSDPDMNLMPGIGSHFKAGQINTVLNADKKFMRGVGTYIKAGKKDVINTVPDPEKKFMRGVDTYIKAGKKNEGNTVSKPDKKFIKGVDTYIKAGKKDAIDVFPEPDKKFMRCVGAYVQAGKGVLEPEKRFIHGADASTRTCIDVSSPQLDKKFMKGVGTYINAGKKDTGSTILKPEKKFIRGISSYIKSAKPLSLPPQKKFMRGVDSYILSGKESRIGAFSEPDKRFIRGMDVYVNAQSDNGKNVVKTPAKKFMRGYNAYIQAGMEGADKYKTVGRPQKKFIPDDANLQAGYVNDGEVVPILENRHVNTGNIQGGEDSHHALSDPGNKRFLKGVNWYFNQNRVPEIKRANEDAYQLKNGEGDDSGVVDEDSITEKRFMKGFEQYMKKSDIEDTDHLITEHVLGNPGMEKRFMKGIGMYLPSSSYSNDRYKSLAAGSHKRTPAESSHPESKGFDVGLGPYVQHSYSDGKRSGSGMEPDHPKQDLESQLESGEKRFLKGYDIYRYGPSSTSQHSERMKRSTRGTEADDMEQISKRFLRGSNPYLQFYANSLSNAKRFMRIPYLLGPSQSAQKLRTMEDVKRNDNIGDGEAESGHEDKRFVRGIDKYLRDYINRQPDKRFMKGVNPYIQAYSMSLGSKRFHPYIMDKRFMKGINPYLQAYYTGVGAKRINWYDSDDTLKEKRFLKGVNPYIRAFSNRIQDKRVGDDDALSWGSAQKRFLRGADPYLSWYMSRPDDKRILGNDESEGDYDDESSQSAMDAQKRFMKGNNPYMWDYLMRQALKRQQEWVPGPQKRFLKGVDQYILAYANMPRSSQVSERSLGKRFIKNYDYYLQLYDQIQKQEHDGQVLKSTSLKRFKRGTDSGATSQNSRYKRFLKGANHHLLAFTNNVPDKRILTGLDYNQGHPPERKRFLKGVGPYLRHFAGQPEKRSNKSHSTELQEDRDLPIAETLPWSQFQTKNKEKNEANKEDSQHSSFNRSHRSVDSVDLKLSAPRRMKRSTSIPYFGLTGNFKTNNAATSSREKRFMRGPNPYLSDVSHIRSASEKYSRDLSTDAGDALMKEMAKDTAVRSPATTRQVHHDVQREEKKHVLDSQHRSLRPKFGARQFMVWNDGEYRLG